MLIDSSAVVIAFATLFPGTILAILGWLVLRAIKGVDDGMKSLNAKIDASVAALSAGTDALGHKVDGLSQQDTQILIQLEGLRARVTTLEYLVHRTGQIPDSKVSP